jgi:hypothetical protein
MVIVIIHIKTILINNLDIKVLRIKTMSLKLFSNQSNYKNHKELAEILRASALWIENSSQDIIVKLEIDWVVKEKTKEA